jgi:hypothetical protein
MKCSRQTGCTLHKLKMFLTLFLEFSQISEKQVKFEVFTVVTMKNGVFWDVESCDSCKNRRFEGTQRLLHQDNPNR